MAEGTPEQVVTVERSYTGRYLKPLLTKEVAQAGAVPPKRKRASALMRQRKAAE